MNRGRREHCDTEAEAASRRVAATDQDALASQTFSKAISGTHYRQGQLFAPEAIARRRPTGRRASQQAAALIGGSINDWLGDIENIDTDNR
jgi:hypothetical protein